MAKAKDLKADEAKEDQPQEVKEQPSIEPEEKAVAENAEKGDFSNYNAHTKSVPWLSEFSDYMAERAKVTIENRPNFEAACLEALGDVVLARLYIEDKKSTGIVKAKEQDGKAN